MDREKREKAEKADAELSVFFSSSSSESGLQHLSQISHFAEHIYMEILFADIIVCDKYSQSN